MFRDADLEGAYANVAAKMNLYVGQPVAVFPGKKHLRLADAAESMSKIAGWDGWYMLVSGSIPSGCNTLIPLYVNAVTAGNYRRRAAKIDAEDGKNSRTTLSTHEVKSGVVAAATWCLIKRLPHALSQEFKDLRVECIVFFPTKLTTSDRATYDRLVSKLEERIAGPDGRKDFDFEEEFDLDGLCVRKVDYLSGDHVAFAHPLGRVMEAMQERRRLAKRRFAKGSAAERGAKEFCNAIYGTLASPYTAVGNVVAANVITATVRALAFLMQNGLNGHQVVTDGCLFRADEVPACTLAECLECDPLYMVRRPDPEALSMRRASNIPEDDAAFTDWYRRHVRRFLGIEGNDPELEWLLDLHGLTLKEVGGRKSFDALCCVGKADHVKYHGSGKGLTPVDYKLRGFGDDAKKEIAAWLTRVARRDRFEPVPLVEDWKLLGAAEAVDAAYKGACLLRRQLGPSNDQRKTRVFFPLGYEKRMIKRFGLVRLGAFLFPTQRKWNSWKKAEDAFRRKHHAGFELLALRRPLDEREEGSVVAVLEDIFDKIRSKKAPHNSLNLGRISAFKSTAKSIKRERDELIEDLDFKFAESIDVATAEGAERLTGWQVSSGRLRAIRRERTWHAK